MQVVDDHREGTVEPLDEVHHTDGEGGDPCAVAQINELGGGLRELLVDQPVDRTERHIAFGLE